ncbi:MAG: holo-ACP synthase [Clostridia bacterium]
MIVGTGIDLVEIERITALMERQPKLAVRVLTRAEQAAMPSAPRRKAEYLAGRYAVKEAVAKALGTGIGAAISFQDIEIVKDELGKPHLKLAPEALKRFKQFEHTEDVCFHVSITHGKQHAIAQVIIELR